MGCVELNIIKINFTCFIFLFKIWLLEKLNCMSAHILFLKDSADMDHFTHKKMHPKYSKLLVQNMTIINAYRKSKIFLRVLESGRENVAILHNSSYCHMVVVKYKECWPCWYTDLVSHISSPT